MADFFAYFEKVWQALWEYLYKVFAYWEEK